MFFFLGNGCLFERSILIPLFLVNFRKALKHFLNVNSDESVSAVLIKNGSILHFNRLYGVWSSSLLSQLELFKVLVFGKVSFNLIKHSLFCFIYFFFILLFFISSRFFVSFVLPVSGQFPPEKIAPRLGLGFGLAFGLGLGLGGKFSSLAIVLEPFYRWKKRRIFACQRNVRFHSSIICAKLPLFVDTKWTKWC